MPTPSDILFPAALRTHVELKPDAILIDDDPLVHMMWRSAASDHAKDVLLFSNVDKLREVLPQIDRRTAIYIDAKLGEGVRGEAVAHWLAAEGFHHLFIATGYRPEELAALPSGAQVVSKSPPWS